MVRTQSIISVSDEIAQTPGAAGVANSGLETNSVSRESSSVRKNRLRNRRGMKALKNISGSSQEETGSKDVTDRLGITKKEENVAVKSCSPRRSIRYRMFTLSH